MTDDQKQIIQISLERLFRNKEQYGDVYAIAPYYHGVRNCVLLCSDLQEQLALKGVHTTLRFGESGFRPFATRLIQGTIPTFPTEKQRTFHHNEPPCYVAWLELDDGSVIDPSLLLNITSDLSDEVLSFIEPSLLQACLHTNDDQKFRMTNSIKEFTQERNISFFYEKDSTIGFGVLMEMTSKQVGHQPMNLLNIVDA